VAGADEREPAIAIEHAVERGGKHLDRCALAQEIVDAAEEFLEVGRARGDGGKGALQKDRHHGGGQSFARNVRHRQPKALARQGDDVVVVAADRAAGHGNGLEFEIAGLGKLGWQQPLLDVAGQRQVVLDTLLLAGDAEELGVLDDRRAFERQRLEHLAVESGDGGGACAALEIQHTKEDRRRAAHRIARLELHHGQLLQRNADHTAHPAADDPRLLGSAPRHLLFDDHLFLAGLGDALDHVVRVVRNLRAQVNAAPAARQAQVQLAVLLAEEEQAALGVGEVQRGIHQRGQDFVERRSTVQDLGHLQQEAEVLQLLGGFRRALARLAELLEQAGQHGLLGHKGDLVRVHHAEADLIAWLEHDRRGFFAVDEGPVTTLGVLKNVSPLVVDDARVPPRDAVVEQHQVVITLAPERKGRLGDFHFTVVAGSVANDEVRDSSWHRIRLSTEERAGGVYQIRGQARSSAVTALEACRARERWSGGQQIAATRPWSAPQD